jgi:hypothetical protein
MRNYSAPQLLLPNPIKAALLYQYLQTNKDLMICNLTGKTIQQNVVSRPGIYVVRVKNSDLFQKLVVVR